MENALRQIYPDMTLPYWDLTLEARLDLPRDSAIFTESFMGNGDGFVKTGPFSNWTVQRGYLYRTVGARFSPMGDHNISVIFSQNHLADISYPYADRRDENLTNYELVHNRVHNWVGGEMDKIETAADDPIFFIYHCFIDYIFEKFRAHQREHGIDPVTDWATYYGAARHNIYSPMGIGNMMAGDGNSEIFARDIKYLDKPSCSRENPDCGTPYLWCNVTRERCIPWTKQEFADLKYTAEQNGKPLIEEIRTLAEYKIELEMEKVKIKLEALPDVDNSTNARNSNDTENDTHVTLGLQQADTALMGVEIAVVVLAACLVCYAAFLITVKCFFQNRGSKHKTQNSYDLNGCHVTSLEHNKIIPENDIIAEITGGDMVKEVRGKEYTLHQGGSIILQKKTDKDASCENDICAISERYVTAKDIDKSNNTKGVNANKETAEVSKVDVGPDPLSEVDDNGFPLYENFVSSASILKSNDVANGETIRNCADVADGAGNKEQGVVEIDELHSDVDKTNINGGIFTDIGMDFFSQQRL